MQRLQAEHVAKMQRLSKVQLGGPENFAGADDPRHTLQENGVADTSGTLMTVTFSAIRSCCRPAFMSSMTPTTKLEQSEPLRKQKSSSASQTWTQPREVRKMASVSTVADARSCCGASSDHRRSALSRGRCCSCNARATSVFRCARILKQNVRFVAKALASAASTTSSGCMATQSCRRNELLKSTTRLGRGPLKDSFQDSRRKVRSKPHTAQASR